MGSNTCPGAWYWLRPHTAALRFLSSHCYPSSRFLANNKHLLSSRPWVADKRGPRGRRRQASGARPGTSEPAEPAASSSFTADPGRIPQQPSPRGPRGSPPASAGPAGSHGASGAAGGVGQLSTLGRHGHIITHVSSVPAAGASPTSSGAQTRLTSSSTKGAAQHSGERRIPQSGCCLTSQGHQVHLRSRCCLLWEPDVSSAA